MSAFRSHAQAIAAALRAAAPATNRRVVHLLRSTAIDAARVIEQLLEERPVSVDRQPNPEERS